MVTDCFTRERSFHAFPKTQRPQGEKRRGEERSAFSLFRVIIHGDFCRISIFMSVHTAFMLRSCLGFNISSSPVCGRPGMCALMGAPGVTKSPTDFPLLPAVSYSTPLIQSWRCVPRDKTGWAETRDLHNSLQVDGSARWPLSSRGSRTPAGQLSRDQWPSGHEKERAESMDEGRLTPQLQTGAAMLMTGRWRSPIPEWGRLHQGCCWKETLPFCFASPAMLAGEVSVKRPFSFVLQSSPLEGHCSDPLQRPVVHQRAAFIRGTRARPDLQSWTQVESSPMGMGLVCLSFLQVQGSGPCWEDQVRESR